MRHNIKDRIHFGASITRAKSQKINGTISLALLTDGNIFYGNQRVGYLDETETLYGINRKGYAVRIGPSERRTACDDLKAWWNEAPSR